MITSQRFVRCSALFKDQHSTFRIGQVQIVRFVDAGSVRGDTPPSEVSRAKQGVRETILFLLRMGLKIAPTYDEAHKYSDRP